MEKISSLQAAENLHQTLLKILKLKTDAKSYFCQYLINDEVPELERDTN